MHEAKFLRSRRDGGVSSPSAAAKRVEVAEDGSDLVVGIVLRLRENRDDPPTRTHDARGLSEGAGRVGDQLEHPHEQCGFCDGVGEGERVDVGRHETRADTPYGRLHHRCTDVESAEPMTALVQSHRDRSGPDAEFDDSWSEDPRLDGRGERAAANFPTAAVVVVVGDAVEGCSRHRRTVSELSDGRLSD
jgi:hypothetical protein